MYVQVVISRIMNNEPEVTRPFEVGYQRMLKSVVSLYYMSMVRQGRHVSGMENGRRSVNHRYLSIPTSQ